MQCWEFKNCGRHEGGLNAAEMGICPAFPTYGMKCWRVAGTFCGAKVQGTFAEKLDNCKECDYYQHANKKTNA